MESRPDLQVFFQLDEFQIEKTESRQNSEYDEPFFKVFPRQIIPEEERGEEENGQGIKREQTFVLDIFLDKDHPDDSGGEKNNAYVKKINREECVGVAENGIGRGLDKECGIDSESCRYNQQKGKQKDFPVRVHCL